MLRGGICTTCFVVNVIRDILGKSKENMEEITLILAGHVWIYLKFYHCYSAAETKGGNYGGDHAILAGLQKLRVPAVVLNLCCYQFIQRKKKGDHI